VAGVANLDLARRVRASADERRVVGRERALAEDAAGAFDEPDERQPQRHERAEHGVELRHQERGGDALAGHVAEHEVELAVLTLQNVAVVAADDRRRLVVVGDVPAVVARLAARQKPRLDARGQLQILFERALLRGRQTAEADADERVGHQALGLDGIAADLTEPVSARLHPPERRVHLAEQMPEVRGVIRLVNHDLKPVAAVEQLLAQRHVNHGSHSFSPGQTKTSYQSSVKDKKLMTDD
jgi:hypothetical protein